MRRTHRACIEIASLPIKAREGAKRSARDRNLRRSIRSHLCRRGSPRSDPLFSSARRAAIGAVLAFVFLGGASDLSAREREKPTYLSPPELFELAEGSETSYSIGVVSESGPNVDDFADLLWPSAGDSPRFPWIGTENGSKNIVPYHLDQGCVDKLSDAEPFFVDKRYDDALELYVEAVRNHPKCYVAYLSLGDAYYFQQQEEEALSWYEKAIALNPYDFLGFFFKANALQRLGRRDEALDAYVHALALKPHRESILEATRSRQKDLAIRVVSKRFLPRGFARKEEDGILVLFDPDAGPHWATYALCKAIWIGEPTHREERTGDREHVWSSTEERQCIASMLDSYYALREEGVVEEDPMIERILSIIDDGTFDGFVFYEIASRIYTHAMLLLSDEAFSEVEKYVRTHVLVSNTNEPTPPPTD